MVAKKDNNAKHKEMGVLVGWVSVIGNRMSDVGYRSSVIGNRTLVYATKLRLSLRALAASLS